MVYRQTDKESFSQERTVSPKGWLLVLRVLITAMLDPSLLETTA